LTTKRTGGKIGTTDSKAKPEKRVIRPEEKSKRTSKKRGGVQRKTICRAPQQRKDMIPRKKSRIKCGGKRRDLVIYYFAGVQKVKCKGGGVT